MQNFTANRLSTIRRRVVILRWWLIGGLTLAVLSAPTFLDIPLPLAPLLALLLLMAVFNLVVQLWAGDRDCAASDLAGQIAVDLVAMGVLLYLSGGATNPLVSLMLLPVAVAALSLSGRWVGGIAALAVALYSFLMLYSLPLPIADVARATRLHLGGMWLTFVVSAALLAWFITRMTASLRERDMQLVVAREEALRDAQVVALGQLAAGAAHELGTPLATMNVLAGELAQDARLPADARVDLDLLRRQIGICKEIVGGLTQKAGIERARQALAANDWLEGLLARWHTLWPSATCALEVANAGESPRIMVEAAIEQAIVNLLNNAAKIAPQDMRVVLDWDARHLVIAVHDRGPGFPPEILRRCGAEPLLAVAEGNGIGLWLTRAAVERSGGRLCLENVASGGVATIELPLGEMAPPRSENQLTAPHRGHMPLGAARWRHDRMTQSVLVVDDDDTFNAVLSRALTRRGYRVSSAADADAALIAAQAAPPDAVVLDLNLGSSSGLNLIRPLLGIAPDCRIVVLTGYASIATAVEAIKLGAMQYFAKPIEVAAIVAAFETQEAIEPDSEAAPPSDPLSVGRLEWEHIQRVLHEHAGNISSTARALRMHRRTLQRKLAKHPVKA